MPFIDLDKEPEKLYYTIGEVADIFKVNTSLIRFWEKEFDILQPKKNKKGNRLFTQADLTNLHVIFHLTKEKGYTLDGAKKLLAENKEGIVETVKVRDTLLKVKQFLVVLKDQL